MVSLDTRPAFRADGMVLDIAPRIGVSDPSSLMFLGCANLTFLSPVALICFLAASSVLWFHVLLALPNDQV